MDDWCREHSMDRILSEVFVLVDSKMPTREYVHPHNEELRAHIKKTWKHSGTQFYEDHISPCGGYRSFVSDTGVLEITKYTKTYSRFTTTVGRGGCKTGRWVSYTN